MNGTTAPLRADALPPRATAVLLAMAALTVVIHLLGITHYGYFRDELYYLASTAHLDWGYVEHPPLSIAVLALVRALFGDSLIALRLVPLLAGVATVWLTGTLARRLGGGAFAQGLAALCAVLSPVFLGTDQYYSMNALDILLWTIAAHLLLRALDRRTAGAWAVLGVVLGLGLMNKISVLWLIAGIGAALLLTPRRRALLTPGPWLALGIALVIFAPHVIWQATHGWPTREFVANATSMKMASISAPAFLKQQVLQMNPGAAFVWLLGIGWGLRPAERDRGRLLAIVFLVALAIVLSSGRSRPSYLSVAYPPLLAMGGVCCERLTAGGRRRLLRPAMAALVALIGAVTVPFAIPMLPPATFVRYQHALGMAPRTDERLALGSLPQQYADMFGWPEMVAKVAEAYHRLTPEEQRHCRIFGQNYGEAGAVDVLGRKLGLPRAMSGHNSYWLWGPGDFDGSVLIIIGGGREDNAKFFDRIEIVGQTHSRWAIPYEKGLDISIGRGMKVPIREAWPMLKHYI